MTKKINLPSLFKGLTTKESTTVSWDGVYSLITGTVLVNDTQKYRSMISSGMEQEASMLKKSMPAITPAVECRDGRKEENIIGLTGVSLCDFDHVDNIEEALRKAAADPHSMMVYRTISGEGLRILYKTGTDEESGCSDVSDNLQAYVEFNSKAFEKGNGYFSRLLGVKSDRSCKNVGRTSIICHDPDAIYNPDSIAFEIDTATNVDNKHKNRCINAIRKHLKDTGWVYEKGSRNAYVSRMGYMLNELGIPEGEATEWAVEHFSDYDEKELRSVFNACYLKTDEHGSRRIQDIEREKYADNGSKCARATVMDIERFLDRSVHLRHNIITARAEIRHLDSSGNAVGRWENVTDRHLTTIWEKMSKEDKRVNIKDIDNILTSAFVPVWNPFKSYFESLPAWDGNTDYICRIADMIKLKTGPGSSDLMHRQLRQCFKKWLVGIVASLIGTGVNNVVFILIGKQGIFKTTFFHNLFQLPLRDYFLINTNTGTVNKDDHLAMSEYALICLEEMESMNTRELNHIKALITEPTISERAAYARYKENRRHIASFCGTGNTTQFLSDRSGNRRWLPFEVESITDPHYFDYLHDMVFAQAVALFNSGYQYWFTDEETGELAEHLMHFEVANMEEELIGTYYRKPKSGEQYKLLTASNILERINANIRGGLSVVKTGQALTKLGYEKQRVGNVYKYRVIELRHDEIECDKNNAPSTLPF